MKEVMRFGKKRMLSPRYVGPYEILKWVTKVAYELKLQSEVAPVNPVFYVSMHNTCLGNPLSILPIKGLGLNVSQSGITF